MSDRRSILHRALINSPAHAVGRREALMARQDILTRRNYRPQGKLSPRGSDLRPLKLASAVCKSCHVIIPVLWVAHRDHQSVRVVNETQHPNRVRCMDILRRTYYSLARCARSASKVRWCRSRSVRFDLDEMRPVDESAEYRGKLGTGRTACQ